MNKKREKFTIEDWKEVKLSNITKIYSGGTPSRSNESYYNGDIPWIKSGELNQIYIKDTDEKITEKGLNNSSAKIVPKNTVLIAMYGATAGKVGYLEIDAAINQAISALECNDEEIQSKYLFYVIQVDIDSLLRKTQGSGQPNLSGNILKEIKIPLPPLPEQKKIAEILTSVDNTIEATQKVIDQTKKVKQGLLQELLTKGIGHDTFKKVKLGNEEVEIPEEWEVVNFGSLVKIDMPPIIMNDNDNYSPTIVRRRHNGIEVREIKKGKEILVKTQFKAVAGTFLISKRQIIHGSCGIVPDGLSNAIISKEYIALKAIEKKLNIQYLDFFSLTSLFQYSIIRTTYGVDDEKFVFNFKWWMNEEIPLPPVVEQDKIVNILLSVDSEIKQLEIELTQLQKLKKGLMQDLLTGKVRVKTK